MVWLGLAILVSVYLCDQNASSLYQYSSVKLKSISKIMSNFLQWLVHLCPNHEISAHEIVEFHFLASHVPDTWPSIWRALADLGRLLFVLTNYDQYSRVSNLGVGVAACAGHFQKTEDEAAFRAVSSDVEASLPRASLWAGVGLFSESKPYGPVDTCCL